MPDPTLLGIIMIPIAISLFCKFILGFDISKIEWAAQALIGVVSLSLIWVIGISSVGMDTEVMNGSVRGKEPWKFSCPTNTMNPCRNGYTCNVRQVCTGTGKDRTCRTESDTCYTYSWEQNWYVKTNVPGSESIEIDRVDRQGRNEPQRYTDAQIGDPASGTHRYKNYVKASAASLFKEDAQHEVANQNLMSIYPIEIHDYYRINRVITPNYPMANKDVWNDELSKALAELGPKREMNMVIVVVNNVGREYAYGLRHKWEGFKKNDAIVVIGLRNGAVDWSETMSWSKQSLFDIEMRHMVERMKGQHISAVDPVAFFVEAKAISNKNFVRRSMDEFEYLKSDIRPPTSLIVMSIIFAIIIGAGTSYWFHVVDLDAALFSGNTNRYRRFRY